MKRNPTIRTLSVLLAAVLLLPFGGCAAGDPAAETVNLMAEVKPSELQPAPISPQTGAAAADFALRLFRAGNDPEQNTLISPLSVLCALAMSANGADGKTLAQIEETLGMPRAQWNAYFLSCLTALRADGKLKLANSIWFADRSDFQVNPDFLQTNADYFGADAYLAPFDNTTVADINRWVNEKTDGMIPEILKELSTKTVMCLVNALAFDAKWDEPYPESYVRRGDFTTQSGEKRSVDFMYSEEGLYLETENATGFLKPYAGGRYAFVALLPNEGVRIEDCMNSLDGASLQALLSDPSEEVVYAAMPKFETEYSTEMSEVLKSMGITDAFDPNAAELSGCGSSSAGGLYLSAVLHKTFLSVTEDGTRAGAATLIATDAAGAVLGEPKTVTLDRPFLYLLVDRETNLPFFLGTMLDPA